MGNISLAEYREIIGGRATFAEIEARHKEAAPAAASAASVPCPTPQAPASFDGCWFGDLPYPPSVNHYYRHVGAKVLISAKGRRYRKMIERLVKGAAQITGKVMLRVDAYPPDLRRRDLDNLLKALQDAITHGGLLRDDCQIKRLVVEMQEPCRPHGKVQVGISRISGKAI